MLNLLLELIYCVLTPSPEYLRSPFSLESVYFRLKTAGGNSCVESPDILVPEAITVVNAISRSLGAVPFVNTCHYSCTASDESRSFRTSRPSLFRTYC
jgi:hypothetical protein